jgi:GTP-binding protein EngB required for normal cell division
MCRTNSPEWANFEKLTRYVIKDWLNNPRTCFHIIFEKYDRLENIKKAFRLNTLNLAQAINICIESLSQLQKQGHKYKFLSIIR